MNESQYVGDIIRAINRMDGKAVKFVETEYSETGTPDIIGIYRGTLIVIEAKVDDNTTSEIQEVRLDEWYDAGAVALVMTYPQHVPADIIHFVDLLTVFYMSFSDRKQMQGYFNEFVETSN